MKKLLTIYMILATIFTTQAQETVEKEYYYTGEFLNNHKT